MLIGQWRGYFFLNFACEEGKITRSRLALRLPSNSLCHQEVVAKIFFCNNGVSFRDSGRGIYVRIKRQEKKWKHEEKDRVLEEHFQKVGEWNKLPGKFRRVRERCSRPNTVLVLYIQKLSNFGLYVIVHQSIPAAPSPPGLTPGICLFFFLWMANSRGAGALKLSNARRWDESRGQMPRYT